MATITPVPLNFEEAHKLADFHGIATDLEWVLQACEKLKEIRRQDPKNIILIEAISSAILVRYGRCHATGERRKISTDLVANLSQKSQELHKFYKNLRDKYIAHSVNACEQNWTTAWIDGINTNNPKFQRVGFRHERLICLSIKEIDSLIELVRELKAQVDALLKQEKEVVQKMAEQIPVKELIKNEFPESFAANTTIVKKTRTRKIKKHNNPIQRTLTRR